jgi:hypothetical protein
MSDSASSSDDGSDDEEEWSSSSDGVQNAVITAMILQRAAI